MRLSAYLTVSPLTPSMMRVIEIYKSLNTSIIDDMIPREKLEFLRSDTSSGVNNITKLLNIAERDE
jgi:hypothetical protein